MTANTQPVSPKGSWLFGNLPEFGADPLNFLERCARDHGDFVPLRFVRRRVNFINRPEDIEMVLSTQARNFQKTLGYRTPFMRRLLGEGLITSEGELWLKQRRLAQPAFHRERIASYASVIVEFAERACAPWRAGETREIHRELMHVTTQVVVRTLFNSEVPREIDDLGTASKAVMERFATQFKPFRLLLLLLPSSSQRRFRRVMDNLDAYIYGLIRARRASGKDTGDLLSMLLQARDEDGRGMNDRQLRDELVTLMVAGLDTTALALTWTFYLLSRHPEVDARLRTELKSALGGRSPTFGDLPKLSFTERVVKEAMRLYPPVWVIGRQAIHDCEVGGHPVRAGTSLILSQWVCHRDPRNFPEPLRFDPDRWTAERMAAIHKYAYFPFGGGPRVCIGNAFALMEATLVLATIAQKWRLLPASAAEIEPWATLTLQPRGGVPLRLEPAN